MRPSRLVLLSGALMAVVAGAAVVWLPRMSEAYRGQGVTSRMAVTSALYRAVLEKYSQTRKWPASIEEIKGAESLKGINLGDASYDFVKKSGNNAIYRLTFDGHTREVVIGDKFTKQTGVPSLGGVSAPGG